MALILERFAQLDAITLHSGSHDTFEAGHCAEEVVAWLAGQDHSDAPPCVSPVLRRFTIGLNDQWNDEDRQKLKPHLAQQIGTAGDGQDEARSYLALDWLIRSFTPAWLDLAGLSVEAEELRSLRRIVDMVSAEAAGPVVRSAQTKAAAAWDAAWDAAWAAAGDAAWDVARAVARAVARDAAGAVARDAAGAAAGAAAWAALRPTVEMLQASALALLDDMTNPSAVTA